MTVPAPVTSVSSSSVRAELGFASPHLHLGSTASQAELHEAIAGFNAEPAVHAMLIQYPIPGQLDYDEALMTVDPAKDVDGMQSPYEGQSRAAGPLSPGQFRLRPDVPQ